MDMGDQYGLPDLHHLLAGRTHFPAFSQSQEQFIPTQANQHYNLVMLSGGVDVATFSDSTTTTSTTITTPLVVAPTAATAACLTGFEMDGGNGRWQRQETLTLLEIRSHLDTKFKEANQKGPLWEEVSRIMAEEHGYQRTGKKCREKFENLFKYYKKTKEGKAGRQDGKHYRFFRQLEALYGETSTPVAVSDPHFGGNNLRFQECLQGHKFNESLSISNSSCFDTSSSENDDNDPTMLGFSENDSSDKKKKMMKDGQSSKRGRRSWKAKIRDFVDSQMRKLMETQEAWLEKTLKTLEHKEQERMSREEEWRKREAARIDQEHKFLANERAWFESRDAALMEALKKVTGKELKASSREELVGTGRHEHIENNGSETLESTLTSSHDKWPESEISSLIHLRTSFESVFQENEYAKETLWVEISAKMACLGYGRSAKSCEEKWEDVNKYIRRSNEFSRKRKENSGTCPRFQLESSYNQGGVYYGDGINQQAPEAIGVHLSTDVPSNTVTAASGSCFPFLMTEGENLWATYGVKINRGEN